MIYAMDVREFIVSLADSFAWPAVVIVAIVLFRVRISALLKRISGFKAGGFEVDFAQELEEARVTAEGLPLGPPIRSAESLRLVELAGRSPRAAILEGWIMVTRELKRLDSQLVTSPGAKRGRRAEIERIIDGYPTVDKDISFLLERLRNLRNTAVHTLDEVNVGDGLNYIAIVERVIPELQDLPPPPPTNQP